MVGKRSDQIEILICVVSVVDGEAPQFDVGEARRGLKIVLTDIGQLVETQQPQVGWSVGVPALVAALGFGEERVRGTRDVDGMDQRKESCGPEQAGNSGEPVRWVEPVERGRAHDQVEVGCGATPDPDVGMEKLDVRVGRQVSPGDAQHLGADVDSEDLVSTLG
ncbi:MAG TPA: hypothetical protein VGI02_14440 [Actinomycetospora sp.]|jgi:hypothetical protein